MKKGSTKHRRPSWWTQYLASSPEPPSATIVEQHPMPVAVVTQDLQQAARPRRSARVTRLPDEVAGLDGRGCLVMSAQREGGGYACTIIGKREQLQRRSFIDTQRLAVAFGAVEIRTRHRVA